MKLEDIGFYTLSNKKAKNTSFSSPVHRGEILLTNKCNFKCPYCRGLKDEYKKDLEFYKAVDHLLYLFGEGLINIRFSGGEPTLYPMLNDLIKLCKRENVKRIAISTNGSQSLDTYKKLIDFGVNDFSISLDGGCCAIVNSMTGTSKNYFDIILRNIKYLSLYNYVTVGVVFNEVNVSKAIETIKYVDSLNPSDIRIISSAQYNKALKNITNISEDILNRHPILKYRIENYKLSRHIRGVKETDCNKCHLVKDDLAIVGDYHFPCIIYLQEGGKPIGKVGRGCRKQREDWFIQHNSHKDPICKNNCLDVCVDYNNKVESYA